MSEKTEQVIIKELKMMTMPIRIEGTAPYCQLRFGEKAKNKMIEAMQSEQQNASKKRKPREPKNFDEDYEQAQYRSIEGWGGINASSFRNACISACKVAGFAMTRAKLSIFIEPDGFDGDGIPLVKIEGEPKKHLGPVRNADGSCDIRMRAMFHRWAVNLNITFDNDQFSASDVVNLLNRAGRQVGVGEGRPDSKKSAGMGWGTFRVVAG